MYSYPQGRILVFCKAPVPGEVKTRLQPVLSAPQCAQLHEYLTQHTLQNALKAEVCPVELWYSGDPRHPFFADCKHRYSIRCHLQQGETLGERMAYALQHTLQTSRFAIIIGTDCPCLDNGHLLTAAEYLHNNPDAAVIGPAEDGGYVLIGAGQMIPAIFDDIAWGGAQVLQQTRDRLHNLGITYNELELLWDIDRPEDLQRLRNCTTAPAGLTAFCRSLLMQEFI
jgi:rSAM/selenodomain-associated transferase 1